MGIIENLKKEYQNEPWLECNNCGVTFKGNHECEYEILKQKNAVYKQALEEIAYKQFNVEPKRVVVKLQSKARQALEDSQ